MVPAAANVRLPLGRDGAGAARAGAANRIEKAVNYMLQHLDERMHIAALGRLAGLSTSTFYQLFKAATGSTPNSFYTRARIHQACGLLRETNLSVKEVAARLGYSDQFYFSRVFKSVSAVSPVHYRNLNLLLQHEILERLNPRNQASPLPCRESVVKEAAIPAGFSAPQIKINAT